LYKTYKRGEKKSKRRNQRGGIKEEESKRRNYNKGKGSQGKP
jgi:hypothetical protein